MKATLFMGAIAIISALAIACGNDNSTSTPPDSQGGAAGIVPAVGMIAPGQFLEWNGERYELVNLLFEEMANADEFVVVGEASQSDVDLAGDARVFRRNGDTTSIYTFVAATDEDPAYWLNWNPVS